jgi:outer membrane protein assembly factor BamB
MRRANLAIYPCLLMLSLILSAEDSGWGDDWPQILGPRRNGSGQEKLPDRFPSDGLKVVWSAPIGQGYAGPAVANGRVVLFHRVDKKERVQAFDAKTGKSLWTTDFPATYRGGVDPDVGPRCVPLIAGDKIYVYGAAGDLHCLAFKDGWAAWSRKLAEDYDAPDGYFGAGSTPILVKKRLLVNVGGKKAGIAALDAETGQTDWAKFDEAASYSSPVSYSIKGKQFVIFVTRLNVVEVDPINGQGGILFPFGKTGPTVNGAMPIWTGSGVFVTASYGVGAKYYNHLGLFSKVGEVWANDDSLSSQYSTPVESRGYLYGIHGREDIPPAHLRCVELSTGKVMWSQDDFGVAHPILADDKLLLLTVDGELVLAKATAKAYQELGRARIARGTTRALPALSNGHFYCRTGDKLLCVKVAE